MGAPPVNKVHVKDTRGNRWTLQTDNSLEVEREKNMIILLQGTQKHSTRIRNAQRPQFLIRAQELYYISESYQNGFNAFARDKAN